jgi:photosystem II stability/assembly factor-like uncharacterized protein
MMKISYLFMLLAVILNSGSVQAQWHLEKCPTKNNLNAISLIDENSGWIVGEEGTILFKSDGIWKDYKKSTNQDLNSIVMIDNKNGWAVGDKGTIVRYNGNYWELYNSPTNKNLLSVSFKDSDNGIAVGEFGTVLIFKNGDWILLENGIRGNFCSAFYDMNDAWIGGGLECVNVPIVKMGINEKTDTKTFDTYAFIKSIFLLNRNDGWAVGSPSTILHYDGERWGKVSIDYNYSSLNSVFFSKENNGISVGHAGTVLIYEGGAWIKESSLINQNLKGCTMSGNTYYAVGDSGTIITKKLTVNDNLTMTPEQESGEGVKVFPNPCSDILNIILPRIDDKEDFLITIFNSSGQIIKQKQFNTGYGNLTFPIGTTELENGIYLLKAVTGSQTNTVRFIIKH